MTVMEVVKRHWATYGLCLLNIIIFLSYGIESFDAITLLDLGANFAPYTFEWEPQRLIYSMFLHGSFLHLAVNMYSLYSLGRGIEDHFGRTSFLSIYFLTGLAAGLSSLSFNLFSVSVGASGALFGLYGYMIVHAWSEQTANRFRVILNFVILIAVYGLIGQQFNFDNAGHFGGVVAGIILRAVEIKFPFRWTPLIALVLLTMTYLLLPRYQVQYFQAFQSFLDADRQIIGAFNAQVSDKEYFRGMEAIEHLPDSTIGLFKAVEHYPNKLSEDTLVTLGYLKIRKKQIDYYLNEIRRESYIYFDSINFQSDQTRNLPPLNFYLNYTRSSEALTDKEDSGESLTSTYQRYDKRWVETYGSDFTFYRKGEKDSLGDWHGRVHDYYADGAIQMKGAYDRGLKEGVFIYYYADSTYSSAGRYSEDNAIGKWESFHNNGRLASEFRYVNGLMLIENSWDSLGNIMVDNGNGEELDYYNSGQLKSQKAIRIGIQEGFEIGYDRSGLRVYQEYYEGGELLKGISFHDGVRHEYDESAWWPYPDGGFDAYRKYLESENEMKADSVHGEVTMKFNVTETGEVHDVRYLQRLDPIWDDHAKKLLLKGPKWNPARLYGYQPTSGVAQVTIYF